MHTNPWMAGLSQCHWLGVTMVQKSLILHFLCEGYLRKAHSFFVKALNGLSHFVQLFTDADDYYSRFSPGR